MKYYTPLVILIWITLAILCFLVIENDRFTKEQKRIMYLTYIIVAFATLAEWLGVKLSGNTAISPWLLKIIKFFDYVLTPLAGGAIILQFGNKSILRKILYGILIFNTLYQIVSLFTGWMISVDDNNIYSHGGGYFIYIIIYFVIIFLVIAEFALHGRKYRKQNRLSLFASLALVIVGISLQELLGGEVRTAYISLVLCLPLLFIHNSEFTQLESDEKIQKQKITISIDPLTGISSRYAYNAAVQELTDLEELPSDLVVFSIDINALKVTNDTSGHSAGDELICGASNCISTVFGKYGKCFRTGGDEFIVFTNIESDMIPQLTKELEDLTKAWHGKEVASLSLSIGSAEAINNKGVSIEKLITIADSEMYKAKDEYYRNNDISRRYY